MLASYYVLYHVGIVLCSKCDQYTVWQYSNSSRAQTNRVFLYWNILLRQVQNIGIFFWYHNESIKLL